jgi:hypothetical protein
MVEIEFSVMVGSPGGANDLLPLLEEFGKQYGIRVNMTEVPWSNGWAEVSKFGIYGHGPDVSGIGTTWIGSLASMQRGRSFPTMRLWGSIEEKLVLEISRIWAELFANLGQNLDECLHRHLDPLAERLNTTLGN